MYKCNFCQKEYGSISTLNCHKKSAKFCIQIQKELNSKLDEGKDLKCEYCNKTFGQPLTLNRHLNICKHKKQVTIDEEKKDYETRLIEKEKELKEKDQIIQQYKDEIASLKSQLENSKYLHQKEIELLKQHSSHPVTNNNQVNQVNTVNINIKLQELPIINNFMDDLIQNDLPSLEKSLWSNSQTSFINVMGGKLVRYMYFTDKSRGNVIYKKLIDKTPQIMKATINNFIMTTMNSPKLLDHINNFKETKTEDTDDEDYGERYVTLTCIQTIITTIVKDNKLNRNFFDPIKKYLNDNGILHKENVLLLSDIEEMD
ncbi:MAG TPA: hypothetical protein DCP55_07805 [Chitinophagaceae bacterium]|nr:hypothetical protein [Chitinophagaceae bacterium]